MSPSAATAARRSSSAMPTMRCTAPGSARRAARNYGDSLLNPQMGVKFCDGAPPTLCPSGYSAPRHAARQPARADLLRRWRLRTLSRPACRCGPAGANGITVGRLNKGASFRTNLSEISHFSYGLTGLRNAGVTCSSHVNGTSASERFQVKLICATSQSTHGSEPKPFTG